MKKFKHLGKIALVALTLTFASCSSDSEGTSTAAGAGTITASVDGSTVTTLAVATNGVIAGPTGFKFLSLNGSDATGKSFLISVSMYTGVGTYTATSSEGPLATFTYSVLDMNNPQSTNNTWTAPYDDVATNGTITITESTTASVKGTFSFKGKNATGTYKQITNGSFDVPLSQMQ